MSTEYIVQVRLLARRTHDDNVVTERTIQRIDLATFDTIAAGERELADLIRFERETFALSLDDIELMQQAGDWG